MDEVKFTAKLTHKSNTKPHEVKLKVFWKTTKKWTAADIADFQNSVPGIAEKLRNERYWTKDGSIHQDAFTCEDFAVRILAQYAASKGLPVKLKTGVRIFRNMEVYDPKEHDNYVSDMWGFAEMVMLSYGAPDMQRVGENTLSVPSADMLKPGDILAQTNDNRGISHHIQVCMKASPLRVDIIQGNSSGVIVRPFTTIMRWLGSNRADPQNSSYAGMIPQRGVWTKKGAGWDYHNLETDSKVSDFMKAFIFFRWNFEEFNK
ncbi:hypothetical protein BUE93_11240 [Chromobacterium amazonense]|uniref:Uncharacterized protein n=1 Tax=Chromobacterium amazonense TaxID=1382803 RepID=A0A2S9X538_9NEIS|nr:hypothetical protein [Chromobacterium amazonense]PRP70839.1 hypothetical protein BUE93_11240 [Chromobacterium amazonense]